MNLITIEALPNQKFGIRLDNDRYDIGIKAINDIMAISITRNDAVIINGARVVAGFQLIPYHYLETGNFMFVTEDDELPFWDKFGITQSLVYATTSELVAIRAGI